MPKLAHAALRSAFKTEPTPHEFKRLSNIDDQEGLRFQVPIIQFYRHDPSMDGRDPARVIHEAVAKALVHYYPFAGRLREGGRRKLVVECTGEGVLFIEADADVRLEQFGDALLSPCPFLEELLYDVEGSRDMLNCPLLLFQVTRLRCGGFILGIRVNHAMTDGPGLVQLKNAVAELARGLPAPAVSRGGVRGRESAGKVRHRLHVLLVHLTFRLLHELQRVPQRIPAQLPRRAHRHGKRERVAVVALRYLAPVLAAGAHGADYADLLVGVGGESHGAALPEERREDLEGGALAEMRGNALPEGSDLAGAEEERPVSHVVQPREAISFGWGKAVYGGPANGGVGAIPGVASFYIPFKNAKGEHGIVVPVCLPASAMKRFVAEIDALVKETATHLGEDGEHHLTLRHACTLRNVSVCMGPRVSTSVFVCSS
ncbi:benzyl alcohol O-benzoyltransferase-like [Phoenix dactylifera]|uniref:Benzyl alcohol O-benzoyltransferase-like n=1 Tax=Phoenix dactylifera TaxID=42345 RepID=A0A8B9AE80_PHODC|nr:benzyl alcohol O-benzoyltransferase-like [Phoenix dactylifera]